MASVFGLELKNVKTFTGREGEASQGDLYLNGKKIGFWSEDANGGWPFLDLEKGFSEQKLNRALALRRPDKHETYSDASGKEFEDGYDIDDAMYDVISLQDYEQEYKKACKKGRHAIFLITDGYHIIRWGLGDIFDKDSFEDVKEVLKDEIANEKRKLFADGEYKEYLFRSMQDFQVGSDRVITLEEIGE